MDQDRRKLPTKEFQKIRERARETREEGAKIERDGWAYVNTVDAMSARRFFGVPPNRPAEPIKDALPDKWGRRVFRVKMLAGDL